MYLNVKYLHLKKLKKNTPITEKQRANNSIKGCTIPADGKSKRSVIKVVEYDKNPEPTKTESSNTTSSTDIFPKSEDYFVLHKKNTYKIILIIFIAILIYILLSKCIFTKNK